MRRNSQDNQNENPIHKILCYSIHPTLDFISWISNIFIQSKLLSYGGRNMPERVSVIEDQEIIKVDSYGVISIDDLRQSMETVERIHQEQGLNKVFVDATKETAFPSTLPTFEFGTELAQSMANVRIAVITSERMKNVIRFLETVAQNRGAEVQIFDSTDAAFDWLKEEP
jgi:hypothetical protein